MITQNKFKNIFFTTLIFLCFFSVSHAKAANVGDYANFYVDQNYDYKERQNVVAILVKTTSKLSFYIETTWWDSQNQIKKDEILISLDALSAEFNSKIYPKLTSAYGTEWIPGIDGDPKITLLFKQEKPNLGGYFRSQDGYSKLQIPDSNEREMIYMPIAQITNPQLKVFLAHEFVHLIEFNQKEKIQGAREEVWLSEARADYASTILGYDDVYEGSNLQRRVNDFLEKPNNSLTEWQNTKYDYAVESLFVHYLVDHYDINILIDSLKSKLVGIPSINEALLKKGFKEDFAKIFTNWTIAIVVNNCSVEAKYCYLNKNLVVLKINPALIFLPLTGDTSLSLNNFTKNWMGNWQKIIGGDGDLKLVFSSFGGPAFQVPYIIYEKNSNPVIKFLNFDRSGKGEIIIKDFGTQYNSLVISPSLQSKISGFEGPELSYPYMFNISTTGTSLNENQALIQKLLDQIESLKNQIIALRGNTGGMKNTSCLVLSNNLYVGVSDRFAVSCLQQFLKSQGGDIYPEGLITGVFGNLTKKSVINFQKKYNIPLTGFVGVLTRQKINQLLNGG